MKDDLPHRRFQLPARERDFFPDVRPLPDQNCLHFIPDTLPPPCWCLRVDPTEGGLMSRGEFSGGKAGQGGRESDLSSGVRGAEWAASPLVRTR